ncbi:MAG: hypothetical protein HRU21_12470, partial [Pseudomonadales bacterium]|nr:hypothetical protein [Pseudomonadales bacterium]
IDADGALNSNLSLLSVGTEDDALNQVLADVFEDGSLDISDFSGRSVFANVDVQTDDDEEGEALDFDSEGQRLMVVAGVLQGSQASNIGLAYTHSDIHTQKHAKIIDSDVVTDNLAVVARDDSIQFNLALGGGVSSKGKFTGVGSISVQELNNRVEAEIGDWDASNSSGSVTARDVSVQARNNAEMINLAGAVALNFGTGASAGLAATTSLIGNQQGHHTLARVANTELEFSRDLSVKAFSGDADDRNQIINNAVGVGFSKGSGSFAFAGAVATSNVDQLVEAAVKNTGLNHDSVTAGSDAVIAAKDYTDSATTAWNLAISGGGALGVAVATNRVDSDVSAALLGDDVIDESTLFNVEDLTVTALRDNALITIDAGVSYADKGAVAPSIGTAVVDGDVTAKIADKAKVFASGGVLVNAEAHTENAVGSGAIGVGVKGGAGALAVASAIEYGETKAYIDDAKVNAYGVNSDVGYYDGDLISATPITDLSDDNDSENNGNDTATIDSFTTGFANYDLQEGRIDAVNGLVVNASSFTKQKAVTIGGSGGKYVAITANVSTTSSDASTQAYIQNAEINQNLSVQQQDSADVTIRASAHEFGLGVSVGGAVATGGKVGGAAVAGIVTNVQSKTAQAKLLNSDVNAADVVVESNATRVSQGVSAGFAVAASTYGFGGAASVVTTQQNGDNIALLEGGSLSADSLSLIAETRQESNTAAGSAGLGTTVGAGVGLVVNLTGGDTRATIGSDSDADVETELFADSVDVDADRLISTQSYAYGVGASLSYGGAAMINVGEISGETRAGIYGSYNNGFTTKLLNRNGSDKAQLVSVDAQEISEIDQQAVGIGIGGSVGVGVVTNVGLYQSGVYSEIVGADLAAELIDVDAYSQRGSDLNSVSVAGGQYAVGVSLSLLLSGQGDSTAEDGTSADAEFDESRATVNEALSTNHDSNNPYLN